MVLSGKTIAGLLKRGQRTDRDGRSDIVVFLSDIVSYSSVVCFWSLSTGLCPVAEATLEGVKGKHYAVPVSPDVWVTEAPPDEEGLVSVVEGGGEGGRVYFHSISEVLLTSVADEIVKAGKRAKVVSPFLLYRQGYGDGFTADVFVWSRERAWLIFCLVRGGEVIAHGVEVGTLTRIIDALGEMASSYRADIANVEARVGVAVADWPALKRSGLPSAPGEEVTREDVLKEIRAALGNLEYEVSPVPLVSRVDPGKGPFFPHVSLDVQEAKKRKQAAMVVVLAALLGVFTYHGTRYVFIRLRTQKLQALTEERKRLADEAEQEIKRKIPYAAAALAAASQPDWDRVVKDLRRILWFGDRLEKFDTVLEKGRWIYRIKVSSRNPGRSIAFMKKAFPRTIFGKAKFSVELGREGFSVVAEGNLPRTGWKGVK